ncbi:hypothetical protein [Phenylobacterium sp.]|uniref:hypothetical protein n=1 Tax=Phenylobacterium sp. TaxID=1871053 RepID=UPI0035B12B44
MTLSSSFRRSLVPVLAIFAGAVVGFGTRHFVQPGEPLQLLLWFSLPLVLALGGSILWWRMLDEVARDAHKTAWYWGASFGMLIGFVALILLERAGGGVITQGLGGKTTPEAFVGLGAMLVIAAQIVGYLVVWVGWWISKR